MRAAADQITQEAGAMAVYIGYYRTTAGFAQETQERARRGDRSPDATFVRLVRELTDGLPGGCRILGSYLPTAAGQGVLTESGLPAVILVETDAADDLALITRHYAGYLTFLWTPATPVGATRQERDAWADATSSPSGAPR
jgi:hypothetical protein